MFFCVMFLAIHVFWKNDVIPPTQIHPVHVFVLAKKSLIFFFSTNCTNEISIRFRFFEIFKEIQMKLREGAFGIRIPHWSIFSKFHCFGEFFQCLILLLTKPFENHYKVSLQSTVECYYKVLTKTYGKRTFSKLREKVLLHETALR